jgi:integrase
MRARSALFLGSTAKMNPRLPKYVTADPGPDGVERFYYRRPGQKKVRITGVPWTPSFMAAYEAAKGGAVVQRGIPQKKTGDFLWLCERYFESAEFKALDDKKTKPKRRNTLLKMCREPIAPNSTKLFGAVMLDSWNKKAVRALRDRVADTPGTAKDRMKALRTAFKFGVDADLCENNPARDVDYLPMKNKTGHHAWTIEEVETYEGVYPIGSKERLAMGILLYAAQRLSDIIRLGPKNVKVRDGVNWLVFTQHKNRNRKPIDMEIPIRPELQELLDSTPLGKETFLQTTHKKPYGERSFAYFFADACVAAGVPGRSHGLRKAAASRLGELGASDMEIMSITGHTTSQEIRRYTESARKRILAETATARSVPKKKAVG